MSFSIKLNKSNNISFRTRPTKSSTTFILTLPRITLSLRVKRLKKKPITMTYYSGTSYKPVNNVAISSMQPIKYRTHINKISRLIKLNTLSNWLVLSFLLSLIPRILLLLLDSQGVIPNILNKTLITLGPGPVSINLNILITTLLILIGLIGIIIKIYVHTIGRLQYNHLSKHGNHNDISSLWDKLASSHKLWQITGIYELDDNGSKENGGIKVIYDRRPLKLSYKAPFYIRINTKVMQAKLGKITLVILPHYYIITNKSEVGIIVTSNIMITTKPCPYAELDDVPEDTEVIYSRWQYVNKDSSKDKRYKDNKKIPICNYGLIHLKSDKGFMIMILSSSYHQGS
ncbi:MAG: hypothetical protein GX321_02250 [Clostridiales bacterium]|nr:hypothetical protein [Clostridiales bacterium]